jgi:hypothetical protein
VLLPQRSVHGHVFGAGVEKCTQLAYAPSLAQLRRLVVGFPPRRTKSDPRSGHVAFVVGKVALGRFSPSTSVSPANSHSTDCSILTGTVDPYEADEPSGLSLTLPDELRVKRSTYILWRTYRLLSDDSVNNDRFWAAAR